nr:hypothetical protein RKQZWNHN_RKQZWNHN_CDS_0004 [Microvirus sp.]CAI9751509.1 hypothetical protein PTLEEYKN_PTLEEYKN_CDS_0004 [Microvirus sp.]
MVIVCNSNTFIGSVCCYFNLSHSLFFKKTIHYP